LSTGRATLLNRSIFYSTVSAIITASLIIVAFASARLRMAHEYGVAILFYVALVLFILSLVNLARGTRIALHDFDHHLQAWIITYELAGAGEG
jgi:hypothetical protein